MDAKTILKELKEVAERAFSLIEADWKKNEDKPNLDLYRLVEGLHHLGSRINHDLELLKFSFHYIRWLIVPGQPSQDTLYLHPYPNLIYRFTWENENDRIRTIKKAEKTVLDCIEQDGEDQSLKTLLQDLLDAKRAYAGYYERSTHPRVLTNSALDQTITFLVENDVNPYRFQSVRDSRNVKKEDCQNEMV
jgi:hypothetical protein